MLIDKFKMFFVVDILDEFVEFVCVKLYWFVFYFLRFVKLFSMVYLCIIESRLYNILE